MLFKLSQKYGEPAFFYILFLILFSLPFTMYFSIQWNSIFIVLLFLNWILEGNWKAKWNKIYSNHFFWIFTALYWVDLLGMTYTQNIEDGLNELTTKLSLLIFPLVFLSTDYVLGFKKCRQLFLGFTFAVLVASFFSLSEGFELTSDIKSGLIILEKSTILHKPYLGMYIVLIIFTLTYLLLKNINDLEDRTFMVLIVYFLLFLYAVQAKMALISFMSTLLIIAVIWLLIQRRWFLFGISVLLLLAVNFFVYPITNLWTRDLAEIDRIDVHIENPGIILPDNPRERIWDCAFDLIEKDNNWMIGAGTGDVQDNLSDCYEEKDYGYEKQYYLNAHNEFLQTVIRNGMLGFFILVVNLVIPFLFALRQEWYLYLIFILLFGFCCLTETILSRQAGVVFYAFFNSFLFFQFYREKK